MVVEGTCPDWSCIKQLRIYRARHQLSLSFPGTSNVGHELSQSGSTLDGFGSGDLQVFAEAVLDLLDFRMIFYRFIHSLLYYFVILVLNKIHFSSVANLHDLWG